MSVDKIEALRARVAKLGPEQREKLRVQVEAAGISWERVAPVEVVKLARPERLPLSPAQTQFWLMHQVNPESAASAIAFSWTLRGVLDREALSRALSFLVDRHEPLRTCFPSEGGSPWQALLDAPFELETSTAGVETYPEIERRFVSQPFDLAKGPLFRAHLVQLGPQEHRLMVSMHHIIADGWSRGVFVSELAEAYRAFREGLMPNLPALSTSFADLVLRQQSWLQGDEAKAQAAFWKTRLDGIEPQSLPIKLDADQRSQSSDTVLLELDPDLVSRMREGASKQGATPFMLLLAVFKLLLHRYTGQTDLAVGTPTAGRRDPDAAGVIGLFVNTLVLRSELDPDASFTDWLTQVRQGFAQSFDNQDLPFATVVDVVGADRRAGQTPLFQTLFQVQTDGYRQQNAAQLDLGDPDLVVTQDVIPLPQAKFDLSWHLMERETGLSLIAEYRTGLFEREFVRRMAAHFQVLLKSALDAPECPIAQLPFHIVPDSAALAVSGPELPVGANVADQVALVAAQSADVQALVFGETVLSYQQLDARATELARCLRGHPAVKDGSRLVVALEREPDLVTVLLAVLRAGAAYVPLDPGQPDERKAHILKDAQADLVITDAPVADVTCPQLSVSELGQVPPADLRPVAPESLAYIIYTSGSTGRPKGVPITHRNLSNLITSILREPGLTSASRCLAVTTVGFDIAGLELFAPLCAGGTVVLADRDTVLSPPALIALMQRQRVTHMQATPALWRALVESGWTGKSDLTILCGGEALDAALARDLLSRSAALWNMYGPTETTIWSAALQVGEEHLGGPVVPVGGPVANTGLQVLDLYGQPLPAGLPGELAISGAGLSPGYWNRPELTEQKFAGGRYRTGDLVIQQADGTLRFLGRTDHQVKLNGFRIEPGEIEAVLVEQGMAEALVVLDAKQPRLIAYCRASGAPPEVAELKRALSAQLPAYMVPQAFVFLDRFELNANGKVDRSKLPVPENATGPTSREPNTETEQVIHDIWCAVLGRDQIGVEDNFFDLGGASVTAMQIVARARDKGLILQPAQLFEHQTIEAQARIAQPLKTAQVLPYSPWQTHIRGRGLSPWLVTLPAPAGSAAHLEQALTAVAADHPVLRFGMGEGWQVDQHASARTRPTVDLGAWARAEVSDQSPWVACITPDGRLAVAAHPMLLDVTSVERLTQLLRERLDAMLAGRAVPAIKGGNIADWLAQSRADTVPAPIGLPGTAALRNEIATPIQCSLDASDITRLRAAAQVLNSDPETLALTALAQCLGQWGSLQQIGIDLLTSTHPEKAQARMLGNLTRLLPLVLERPQGDPTRQVSQVGQVIRNAASLGVSPRDSGGGATLLSWRSSLAADVEWLSRPTRPVLPGYALTVEAELGPQKLGLTWRFDREHIPRATVENLAKRHLSALTALCAEPARKPVKAARPGNRLDQLKAQIRRPKG